MCHHELSVLVLSAPGELAGQSGFTGPGFARDQEGLPLHAQDARQDLVQPF
jgi:hypothetical protein